MSNTMTPRQRVFTAMAGEMPDHVPFSLWNNKLPGGDLNRQLYELGMCVINKSSVYRVSTPGIRVESEDIVGADGIKRERTTYHTQAGKLSRVQRKTPGTTWTEKPIFSGPEDYEPLEALIRSRIYTPCYEKFQRDDQAGGEQTIGRPGTIKSPLQDIIYSYMRVETFSIEWMERRERVLRLYDLIAEDRRKQIELLAACPDARYGVIEGNISPEIMGEERFKEYCIPAIEEACDILHAHGKLAGAHLDANNRLLAPLVAQTSLDIIESFTPSPECDLSVAEARQIWPKKAIFLHFPSSIHLRGPARVQEAARQILREAAPGDRFIFGTCEDVPERGANTLAPLAQVVHKEGRTPLI